MVSRETPSPIGPVLVLEGSISEDELLYALDRLGILVDKIDEPVLLVRVKLGLATDPARERPAIAKALLDVNGDLIRAHVAAETPQLAVDLLQQRLRDKLEHRSQRRIALRKRHRVPAPGEWRHGDVPTARPAYYDRPIAERQIVRRKTFAIDELTPDEAAFDMEQLDYDFYLFRDLASGEDALIERDGEGAYRMTRMHPLDVDLGPTGAKFTVSPYPVPTLRTDGAIERLEAAGQRYLFYIDPQDERGHIAYHRYDGHYGLITSG